MIDNDLTYDLIDMTRASTMTGKLVVSVQILTAHDSRDSKGSGRNQRRCCGCRDHVQCHRRHFPPVFTIISWRRPLLGPSPD